MCNTVRSVTINKREQRMSKNGQRGKPGPSTALNSPSEAASVQSGSPAHPSRKKGLFEGLDSEAIADGRHESKSAAMERIERLTFNVELLGDQIRAVDDAIHAVAKGLRISQPPMSGKLDVRWWKIGRDGVREPVFVRWTLIRGQMRSVRVKRIHFSPDGAGTFKINRDRTKRLVEIGQQLMGRRSVLMKRLADLARVLYKSDQGLMKIVTLEEEARRLRYECCDALEAAGYEATPRAYID